MKYINKLNDEQLLELISIYAKSSFKRLLSIDRNNDGIEIDIEVELEDDESEEGFLLLEERYTLYDYDVTIWDYQCNNEIELLREYRQKILGWFGNQYALDYLLK